MQIKVKSIGIFKKQFGTGVVIEISNPPYNVRSLLKILERKFAIDFTSQVLPPEGQENHVALLVRGRHIGSQAGLDTEINDGEEVFFLVMMSGG